jgi:hypothetical protein
MVANAFLLRCGIVDRLLEVADDAKHHLLLFRPNRIAKQGHSKDAVESSFSAKQLARSMLHFHIVTNAFSVVCSDKSVFMARYQLAASEAIVTTLT